MSRTILNLWAVALVAFYLTASTVLAAATDPPPLDWSIIYVAIISGVVTLATSSAAMVVSMINNKKLTVLHTQINSRLDLLLEDRGKVEHAKGKVEGKAEEKAEEKARSAGRKPKP